jgi:tetratricopeptide (TPR) repeat protein
MKIIFLLLLASGSVAFAQSNEYLTLDDCAKAIRANPKNSMARYRMGEIFFMNEEWNHASLEFLNAQRGDLNPKWIEVGAHIYAGMIYDLTNQRPRAINEYRKALLTLDNTRGALDQATRYIESPYSRP